MGFRLQVIGAIALTVMTCLSSQAGDLVIETEVFQGNQKQPEATTLTVFSAGNIYDFAVVPQGRITIFNKEAQRFILADRRELKQSILTADELVRFVAAAQERASRSENELIRFASAPEFEISFDEITGELSLTSAHWDYRVETSPVTDPSVAEQYSTFANWFTQLNALFRPIPPNIRMALNEQLEQHRRLPVRVEIQIKHRGQVQVKQHSRHRMLAKLGPREQKLIREWNESKAKFQMIPFHELRSSQLR